ncbi:hypothetical protein PIB30_097536, partial [Stylosanthes scabra]|nr:hypothetical protein [Stylosanthes scabra]
MSQVAFGAWFLTKPKCDPRSLKRNFYFLGQTCLSQATPLKIMSRLEFRKQTSRRQVTFGLCINLAKKIQGQEVNMTASHLWCLEARTCHIPSKLEKRDSRHQKSTRSQ